MSVSTAKAARAAMKEKAQRLAKKPAKVKTQIDMGSMDAAQQGVTTKAQKAYRTARKDGGKVHGKTAPKRADKVQRRIKKEWGGETWDNSRPNWSNSATGRDSVRNILGGALEFGGPGASVPTGGAPAAAAPRGRPSRSAEAAQRASTSAAASQVPTVTVTQAAPRAASAPSATSSLPPPSTPMSQAAIARGSQVPPPSTGGSGPAVTATRSGYPLAAATGAAGAGMLGLTQIGNQGAESPLRPSEMREFDNRGTVTPAPLRPSEMREFGSTTSRPASRPAAPAARQPTADELMDYYNAPGSRSEREMAQLAAMRNAPEAGPMKRGGAAKKKSAKKSAKGR